jgi:putative ABC transport system substrate-binding protein
MDRRRVLLVALVVLGTAPIGAPGSVRAQTPRKVRRVGTLDYGGGEGRIRWWKAFSARLHELGYVEGETLQMESRFATGSVEHLPALAAELVARNVDVLVTASSLATAAARRATATVPIVTTTGPDPVQMGFAASFARPGGNVTGLTSITSDLSGKRLELIKTLSPKASVVGILFDANSKASRLSVAETKAAAGAFGVTLLEQTAHDLAGIEAALKNMSDARADMLIVVNSALFFTHRHRLGELALQHRLPTVTGAQEYVEAGSLIGYGTDYPDLFRRAAEYVDRIFKGAKPGELPIERPSKFELVINLKTAKALGVAVPPALVFRADHLIQ